MFSRFTSFYTQVQTKKTVQYSVNNELQCEDAERQLVSIILTH